MENTTANFFRFNSISVAEPNLICFVLSKVLVRLKTIDTRELVRCDDCIRRGLDLPFRVSKVLEISHVVRKFGSSQRNLVRLNPTVA